MIRRRHPKGTDFSKVSAAEIAATEEWINNYPRKILGYKSSEVMFRECLREIGLSTQQEETAQQTFEGRGREQSGTRRTEQENTQAADHGI